MKRKLWIALCLAALLLTGCAFQQEDTLHDSSAQSTTSDATTVPTTQPASSVPEETEPQVTQPEQTEPDATQPEVTQPEVSQPEECTHDYQSNAADATCTKGGTVEHTCKLCGHSYEETVAELGHSYGSWSTTAATCTKDGSRNRSCTRCGDKQTEKLSATGHAYGAGTILSEASSCSAQGKIRYTCTRCGNGYDTSYQGNHRFGAPYPTMFSGIRIECEDCGYFMTDFYTWREDSYSDCDKTAPLYCDTIRLKESAYTGPLSTWSDTWLEWHEQIMTILQARAVGGVGLTVCADPRDYGGSLDGFMAEFNRFLDSFAAYYGWRPVWDGEPYADETYIELLFETEQLFPLYEKATKAMSASKKNALVKDLVAFHIHQIGLRDGMQAYNSLGAICDYMYYGLLRYDQNYRYNSAFRGLTSGFTMCQGYSEIFQLFAEYCGIKCEIVEGTMMGEAHAWNRVTFSDGTQRYVDVTNLGYDYYILVPWSAMTYSHKLK